MARLIDLLTFSGKVGDLVGCKGAHGFYIRSRPRKSRKPPTPKQLEVRARLAMVMGFLKPLKTIIHEGFSTTHGVVNKVTAMNAASSHLLNHGVLGDYPDIHIDPAEVRLSRGNLVGLVMVELRELPGKVEATWPPIATPFSGYNDDRVTLVCYNPAERSVMATGVMRSEGTLTVDVSDEPPGSQLLVYLYVADRERKQFSNSQFLGTLMR